MTRKEALSKAIMTLIYFQVNFCKSKEAVDNTQAIIDTLERIEKEPCEDCVSRAEVINGLQKICDECDSEFCGYCRIDTEGTSLDSAKEMLKRLPSVTPTRTKGKWIGHGEHCENLGVIPSGLGAYEWCSNCDCGIDVREWHRNHYNYCPNCGADMREVEE